MSTRLNGNRKLLLYKKWYRS